MSGINSSRQKITEVSRRKVQIPVVPGTNQVLISSGFVQLARIFYYHAELGNIGTCGKCCIRVFRRPNETHYVRKTLDFGDQPIAGEVKGGNLFDVPSGSCDHRFTHVVRSNEEVVYKIATGNKIT